MVLDNVIPGPNWSCKYPLWNRWSRRMRRCGFFFSCGLILRDKCFYSCEPEWCTFECAENIFLLGDFLVLCQPRHCCLRVFCMQVFGVPCSSWLPPRDISTGRSLTWMHYLVVVFLGFIAWRLLIRRIAMWNERNVVWFPLTLKFSSISSDHSFLANLPFQSLKYITVLFQTIQIEVIQHCLIRCKPQNEMLQQKGW